MKKGTNSLITFLGRDTRGTFDLIGAQEVSDRFNVGQNLMRLNLIA